MLVDGAVLLCRMPRYAGKFIEHCLMVTADHGPAVSGAHNTIVCARAGKDLISSLVSGLLTIVRHVNVFCAASVALSFLMHMYSYFPLKSYIFSHFDVYSGFI